MADDNLRYVCPRCDGTGRASFVEDGRRVSDACYACSRGGWITANGLQQYRITQAAQVIGQKRAAETIYRYRHPEGPNDDDIGLYAGEAGMSVAEYEDNITYRCIWDAERELEKMAERRDPKLALLLARHAPLNNYKLWITPGTGSASLPARPVEPEPPQADGDLPF